MREYFASIPWAQFWKKVSIAKMADEITVGLEYYVRHREIIGSKTRPWFSCECIHAVAQNKLPTEHGPGNAPATILLLIA